MEAITNAANAAANYLGYDQTTDKKAAGDTLGEIAHDRDGRSTTARTGNNVTGTNTGANNNSGLASLNPFGSSTAQSGTEPVNGRLGSGTAGQPYDAGNVDDGSTGYGRSTGGGLLSGITGNNNNNNQNTSSGLIGGLTGNNRNHQNTSSGLTGGPTGNNHNQGTSSGLLGGLTGGNNNNHNNNHNQSTSSGLLGGLTGNNNNHQNTTGGLTGNNHTQGTSSGLLGGLTGNNSNNRNTTGGLTGNNHNQGTSSGLLGGLTGNNNHQNTSSGRSGGSGLLGGLTGNNHSQNTSSGYGNTTSGYGDDTHRGIGADSTQQGNHYTSTTVAGKLGDKLGLGATHRVDDGSSSHTHGLGHTHGSSHSHDRNHSHDRDSHNSGHGLGGAGNVGQAGYHATGLGSDRSAVTANDRYLFNSSNAPGGGGRHSRLIDDFTDANIHHEGSGRAITGDVGSDASSGIATGLGANTSSSGSHHNTQPTSSVPTSSRSNDRSRRPGYERMGSGLSYGNAGHGLNYGRPKESIGSRLEHKVEEYGAAAGVGAAGYGATRSGRDNTYGSDGRSGTDAATAGIGAMNLNQRSTDNAYSGNQNPYDTNSRTTGSPAYGAGYSGQDSTRGSNYATPTASGLTSTGERGHGDGRDFGATAPRNANDSTYGVRGLEQRIAGAPHPDGNHGDQCEVAHHNIHATGAQAHVDGAHKPTFLNYQHDQFGIPIAKGE